MTDQEKIFVIENNLIGACTKEEKRQVMEFAFGEDVLEEKDWYSEQSVGGSE